MPLLWLSIAFLLGIVLAANLPLPAGVWLLLALVALLWFLLPILWAWWGRNRPSVVPATSPGARHLSRFACWRSWIARRVSLLPLPLPLLFLALFLGAARYSYALPHFTPEFIAWYNRVDDQAEHEAIVEGVLVKPPDMRETAVLLTVRAEQLRFLGEDRAIAIDGLLLARALPSDEWQYGDRLRLEGVLEEPSENEEFSYRDYLARQGVYSYMQRCRVSLVERRQGNPVLAAIYTLRDRTLSTIYLIFPDPEASLLSGILLGVETGIPAQVQDAFRFTGTAHIIAISGFNFAVLAGLFSSIFLRLLGARRRFLALVLSAVVMAMYTILVGGNASVVRAALMGGLGLFARSIGRRQDGLNSLIFVAALMALFTPFVLWDVGFQLSFTSTLGLILYAEPLSQAFIRIASRRISSTTTQRLAGPAGEYFLFTLAAQFLSLPVSLYHFQRFSLTAWAANPLILPAQPPVMVLGGLAVILGLVFEPLGRLVGYLAWPFVAYTIRVVELFARIPGGSFTLGPLSLPLVLLFYGLVITMTFMAARWQKVVAMISPSLALLALGSLTVIIWQSVFTAPDGRLHLIFLDVGDGDAILIQTPTGRNLLIDGGQSSLRLSDALGRRLPYGQRKLDMLIVAAPDEEQVGALPRVFERFPPRSVLWAGPPQGSYSARVLLSELNQARLPVITAESGQTLDFGEGARLMVVYAGKRGAILLVEWRRFRLLLPVGVDFEAFQSLENGRLVGQVTALLLSDGGYAPVNPPEWIEALRPQLVLLSVDAKNRRGLPSVETMEAVRGYPILRTDQNGWIHLATDGKQMWVEVERK